MAVINHQGFAAVTNQTQVILSFTGLLNLHNREAVPQLEMLCFIGLFAVFSTVHSLSAAQFRIFCNLFGLSASACSLTLNLLRVLSILQILPFGVTESASASGLQLN
jgi:hypothetical protein